MEFIDVVVGRRMTRSFSSTPLMNSEIESFIALASRAPSAGKTQGWHVVTLTDSALLTFWDTVFPISDRDSFAWPGLFDAPMVTLWFADPNAYVERYSEPDKKHTGLGAGVEAWQAPYWTIDASMAMGTFLLAVQNAGLGALLFAVFRNADALRQVLGIPENLELIGAVAVGHPGETVERKGVSASRRRRAPEEIIHRDRW